MNNRTQIVGAALVGAGMWLCAWYVQSLMQRHHERVAKRHARDALHTWEGEGGTIIDALPCYITN